MTINTTVTRVLLGGAVVAMDGERRVLDPGAVATQDDRIVAVGTPDDLLTRYPQAIQVDLGHTAIMPGLVDTHGHAGHGLTFDNVIPVAAIPQIAELNIGHFLIGEAIFTGLEGSVRRMRALMDAARSGG